jgi:hypothetical protein
MTRTGDDDRLLHLSLVVVWLVTAVVSLVELDGQSRQVLAQTGVTSPPWLVLCLIVGGAAADLAIGLALWWRPAGQATRWPSP